MPRSAAGSAPGDQQLLDVFPDLAQFNSSNLGFMI